MATRSKRLLGLRLSHSTDLGVIGKIIAGIESILDGEVTAFTTELEKARMEVMERMKNKALALGGNAIVGIDLETNDL